MTFISGEQGNKGQILRATGEKRRYWGTGNIRKQNFDFWGTGEQANFFRGTREHVPPGRASMNQSNKSYDLMTQSNMAATKIPQIR